MTSEYADSEQARTVRDAFNVRVLTPADAIGARYALRVCVQALAETDRSWFEAVHDVLRATYGALTHALAVYEAGAQQKESGTLDKVVLQRGRRKK